MAKKSKLKKINDELDKTWAKIVKILAKNCCEYCGVGSPLNSHHIYSRSNLSTRWNVLNGVCLCVSHHTFNSTFSAHKTPTEFTQWLYETKGEDFMDELRIKAHSDGKMSISEREELLLELKQQLKELEQ